MRVRAYICASFETNALYYVCYAACGNERASRLHDAVARRSRGRRRGKVLRATAERCYRYRLECIATRDVVHDCSALCVALVNDTLDASLVYFAREAHLAHDYPIDAIVLRREGDDGAPTGELMLVYQSQCTCMDGLSRLCMRWHRRLRIVRVGVNGSAFALDTQLGMGARTSTARLHAALSLRNAFRVHRSVSCECCTARQQSSTSPPLYCTLISLYLTYRLTGSSRC